MTAAGACARLLLLAALAPGLASATETYTGMRRMDVAPSATRTGFSMALLYPSSTPAQPVALGPFEMKLAIGGGVTPGRHPLAVISHGSGGGNLNYRSIALALVQRDFVVALPLHPGDNFRDRSAQGTPDNWRERPRLISAAIDALLSEPTLAASLDPSRIAAIGHSMGGYSVLAAAGGTAETRHIAELCSEQRDAGGVLCRPVLQGRFSALEFAAPRDARIGALVLLAPLGLVFRSPDALVRVRAPALMLCAERDAELTEPWHCGQIAKNFPDPQLLTRRVIANAGHFAFITPFPAEMATQLGAVAADPPGFDRVAFHCRLGTIIGDYLTQVFAAVPTGD